MAATLKIIANYIFLIFFTFKLSMLIYKINQFTHSHYNLFLLSDTFLQ